MAKDAQIQDESEHLPPIVASNQNQGPIDDLEDALYEFRNFFFRLGEIISPHGSLDGKPDDPVDQSTELNQVIEVPTFYSISPYSVLTNFRTI